ncbi:hypothetical protein ACKVMT_07035 [Halobacteriales archaeon Cl-PHB]
MPDENPRPALQVLQEQQAELVDHDQTPMTDLGCSLREGFQNRRELVRWYQAATVRTFGFLCESWQPKRLLSDRTLLQACITSERRQVWATGRPLMLDAARAHRRVLEEQALLPATHRAYNQLRKMAGEYIGDDGLDPTEVDPTKQNLAMRPAFSRKDQEQRRTLEELWDGFADEDALRDWLHALDQPTNGGLPDDFAALVMRDDVAVSYLVRGREDERLAKRWRELLAIAKLLPAFETGIKRMDAGELAKRTRGELEVAQA